MNEQLSKRKDEFKTLEVCHKKICDMLFLYNLFLPCSFSAENVIYLINALLKGGLIRGERPFSILLLKGVVY